MTTTGDNGGESQVYEVGYLVLPSIPEDNLSDVVDSIKKVISDAGAKELDGEAPFMRRLAYSMTKTVGASKYVVDTAYLGWLKFEAEPSQVAGIKTGLESIQELLRFLLIKAPRESVFTFAKAREAAEGALDGEEARDIPEEGEPAAEADEAETADGKPDEEVVE